jgi:hypothetical protein
MNCVLNKLNEKSLPGDLETRFIKNGERQTDLNSILDIGLDPSFRFSFHENQKI